MIADTFNDSDHEESLTVLQASLAIRYESRQTAFLTCIFCVIYISFYLYLCNSQNTSELILTWCGSAWVGYGWSWKILGSSGRITSSDNTINSEKGFLLRSHHHLGNRQKVFRIKGIGLPFDPTIECLKFFEHWMDHWHHQTFELNKLISNTTKNLITVDTDNDYKKSFEPWISILKKRNPWVTVLESKRNQFAASFGWPLAKGVILDGVLQIWRFHGILAIQVAPWVELNLVVGWLR